MAHRSTPELNRCAGKIGEYIGVLKSVTGEIKETRDMEEQIMARQFLLLGCVQYCDIMKKVIKNSGRTYEGQVITKGVDVFEKATNVGLNPIDIDSAEGARNKSAFKIHRHLEYDPSAFRQP